MSIPSSGSSTWRRASTTSSGVAMGRMLAQEPHFLATLSREEVDPVDETHPVAARAHDERVGARRVREEADAAKQVAVRDAGRDHDHLAMRELVGGEDTVH